MRGRRPLGVQGTPKLASATAVTFTVTDALGGKATLAVRLTVKAVLAFAPGSAAKPGQVNVAYSWRVPVTGSSKMRVFAASGIPPGLELDRATGILSGTPSRAGVYRITVSVLGDGATKISRTFTLRISK